MHCHRNPSGLWGIGGILSAGVEAGLGSILGAGANGSYGGGVFYDPTTGQSNNGQFASFGAIAQVPNNVFTIPTTSDRPVGTLGASASATYGMFVTNANSANELRGPFDTYSLNTSLFSIQFGISNGTWIVSGGIGPSAGGSVSRYPTTTFYANDDAPFSSGVSANATSMK